MKKLKVFVLEANFQCKSSIISPYMSISKANPLIWYLLFFSWSVFFDDDFDEDDKEDNNTLTLVSELYGRECIEIDVEDPAKEPESFRHIGNINAYKSAISLYTEKNFNGHELYFDGTTLTLPEPIAVGSYGFTGVDRYN